MKFTLPGLPPSVNHSHFARGRRLKPETSRWIESAGLIMLGQKRGQEPLPADAPLELRIILFGRWFTKGGAFRRVDLSNRVKVLEDVVAKVAGFDDSRVATIIARKIAGENEWTEVRIEPIGEAKERAA